MEGLISRIWGEGFEVEGLNFKGAWLMVWDGEFVVYGFWFFGFWFLV